MNHTRGEIAFTKDGVLMSDDGKPLVCHDNSPNRPREQSAANRARLCLCWNTHDELLEALKACRDYLHYADGPEAFRTEYDKANAAIAKATGGAA